MAALLAVAAPALAAPPAAVLSLADPPGDDRGPGSYLYPTGSEYRPGDFDLRRFSVRVEGQEAVLEVTLGANVRRHIVAQRGDRADLDLENGIYTQNVDVYVDTTPGQGLTEGLPGRRIAFAPGSGWERAIAIVPRPGPTRSALRGWNAEAAQRVATPGPVRSAGPTLTVRVPLAQLGGAPQPSWGWSVVVSGAAWDSSFAVVDRLRGANKPNAFTLPVYGVPEERAFGGGKLNSGNPNVIDVLLPAGVSQAEVLGSYSSAQPAVVPMVYPDPAARARALASAQAAQAAAGRPAADGGTAAGPAATAAADGGPAAPSGPPVAPAPAPAPAERLSLQIASIDEDTVVIPAPEGGVRAWQIGTVVDAEGRQQGKVVVTTVANGFVLASVTEGKGRVQPGHRVLFARSAPPAEKR
ncbi:MAG TPA: glucodextranase DOMON-like domain-containing protein [Aggregicoccus sp.]|nr:glucodextranase DOMON-like domain-containing protein [Aggregicoccus sp.]